MDTIKLRKEQSDKPLFNLERDGLTQGSLAVFLNCREQFYQKFFRGWTAYAVSTPIAYGSMFHDVLAQVCANSEINHSLAVRKYISRQNQAAGHSKTAAERDKLELLGAQVAIQTDQYTKHWSEEDQGLHWLAREKVFRFQHNKTWFTGRFDGVFRNGADEIWLLETKTKARIDEDGLQAALPYNLQTMLYCMAIESEFGIAPTGVLYDVVKVPQLRQGISEIERNYLMRVKDDVSKNPKDYFFRYRVTFSPEDLPRFAKHTLTPILHDFLRWYRDVCLHLDAGQKHWQSACHYMNPNALFTGWGRCDLFNLLTKGDTWGLYRRKVVYPELQD